MIPIYKPYLEKYKESAISTIKDEWISNHGIFVNLASEKINEIFGVKYNILMNNGTAATHCLMLALKYKHPHIKKVYVPNHVFIAPLNCAVQEYGIENVEVLRSSEHDVNFCQTEEYLKSLEENSALLVVHNLGYIVDVGRIKQIRPDIVIVEDNCEGIFGKHGDTYSGTTTLCSALSFYGNKTITSGEGGCFMTNDIDLYNHIKVIYSHGMSETRYVHHKQGYNYRMTNIQAALLYDQLNDIEHILRLKSQVFERYDTLLNNELSEYMDTVSKLNPGENTTHSLWMYTLFMKDLDYHSFEQFMTEQNVQVRPLFYDVHDHEHLKEMKKDSLVSSSLFSNGFMIPSYPSITEKEQTYIAVCIKNYIITRGSSVD